MVGSTAKHSRKDGKSRDFRKEAGKPKLSKKKELSSSEASDSESNSDVESDLSMPEKDHTRKKSKAKGKQRSVASREKSQKQKQPAPVIDDTTDDEVDEEKAKEADSKIAPHALLLLGSTYHISFSPVTHHQNSYFVPWCGNFFSVLFFMAESLHSSTLVQEKIPDFFSPALYWYGSMVWILQILIARDYAGALTRAERQVMNTILRTYPAEQWTILSPMIGFLQSLGTVKTTDPMYKYIVPSFPTFVGFSSGHTYRGISNVPSIQRIPPILAYQQFIHSFGAGNTTTRNGFVLPQAAVTDTAQFIGLNTKSAESDDWQCFVNAYGWIAPPETGNILTMTDMGLRTAKIRRWGVPSVSNTSSVTDLKSFMGLSDTEPIAWMARIIRMIAALKEYFPGSINLSDIAPTTAISSIAEVKLSRSIGEREAKDVWYHGRKESTIEVFSPAGLDDASKLRLSAATCFNATLDNNMAPNLGRRVEPGRLGPFFVNTADELISIPIVQYESGKRSDPVLRFGEIIESHLFDRNGGKK